MKLLAAVSTLVFALSLTVFAGPDDQYIAVYSLIQMGDTARSSGNATEAVARYTEARTALQQLQRAYPFWETAVVNFRLKYLATRLSAIEAGGLSTPVTPTVQPPGPTTPANAEWEAWMQQLQVQLQQLQVNNNLLEARLREALSVRPAAADPQELARAEKRIRSLAKENDLLKVTLNEAQANASATVNAKQMKELRQQLDAANHQLAGETARVTALRREKGNLEERLRKTSTSPKDTRSGRAVQRQLDEANAKIEAQKTQSDQFARDKTALLGRLKELESEAANASALRTENELLRKQVASLSLAAPAPGGTNDLTRRLAIAETQIAALVSERNILQLERSALERHVTQLQAAAPGAGESARLKQFELEVASLQQQLAAANEKLAVRPDKKSGAQADALATQLGVLRAKLDVFEAKPVPYSEEELAMFRQTPAKLAATDPTPRKSSSIPKPPAGSGTLIAEAQRYFARGEYSQAEAKYEQVLRQDNSNVYTLANLAAIQLEEGKLDEAEKNLKQALRVSPDDAYCLQTLGYLKFRQEKFDEAFTALSRAAQLNPDSAEIQNYLGVTLTHQGQRAPAETALRKAIQLQPGYASAHNNLAVVYATQNPPLVELARWHYQKALAAGQPKNPELEKLFEQ